MTEASAMDWLEQAAHEARQIIDRLYGEASATLHRDHTSPHSGDIPEDPRAPMPHEPTPSPASVIEAAIDGTHQ
ncbi:MAG TPA: hypothetical protein VFW65_38735 [Pseudonocardiaceae bacterium]|nr:hypothetical protein [Pseudonocardiaceae bacterium]